MELKTFLTNVMASAWQHRVTVACIVGGFILYLWFVSGLSTNPPGIYLDESGGAYNAYTIATTGRNEFGEWFPVYFQFYTESNVQYSNPVHIYLMSLMYLIVPPSTTSARVWCATMTFIAALLLGFLANRISGRRLIGVIVTVTAVLTPWLFEASRLILEAAVFPLALSLFLFFLYRALSRTEWKLSDCILVGLSLGMLTYSYTIGRFLGPVLGFGMLMLVTNWKTLLGVVKTWIAYTVSLIPFLWVYFSNNAALTRRFSTVTWVNTGDPWSVLWEHFKDAYLTDISLDFLLDKGDPLARHHIPGSGGELLAATFALAMVGIVLIFFRHWRERWWWFIIYGLLLSVVPGALTVQRYHALRTIAFPVFLLVLTIPAMMWLLGPPKENVRRGQKFADWLDELPERLINGIMEWKRMIFNRKLLGSIILTVILVFTLNQADDFQVKYGEVGPTRGQSFDQAYQYIFDQAAALPDRPIYLEDGFWGPAYIHAYWYATVKGMDRSDLYHLAEREVPPEGALVLSSNNTCDKCEIIGGGGGYLLYRNTGREGVVQHQVQAAPPTPGEAPPPVQTGTDRVLPVQVINPEANKPHGIAVDKDGNILITDAMNHRVLKMSPAGAILSVIGQDASPLVEPSGIVLDPDGNIYVTDATRSVLVKYNAAGQYVNEWSLDAGMTALRDVAISSDKKLFVTDGGRARIVRFDPVTVEKFDWGENGSAPGQLADANGVDVSGNEVFVADAVNDRINVYDFSGKFLRTWPVPQWSKYQWHRPDVVVDRKADRVYVTSGWTHDVLMFDMKGALIGSLKPAEPSKYCNPSGLFLWESKGKKFLYVLNTATDVVEIGPPSIFVFDLTEPKK